MAVDSFDPSLMQAGLTAEALQRFLQAAARLEEPGFGLDELSVKRLGPLARQEAGDWQALAADRSDDELVALVKFFTLAEESLPGWESGAKSPVVTLVRELKGRDAYPAELTAWIKGNTTNRFLPHGSLMDRL